MKSLIFPYLIILLIISSTVVENSIPEKNKDITGFFKSKRINTDTDSIFVSVAKNFYKDIFAYKDILSYLSEQAITFEYSAYNRSTGSASGSGEYNADLLWNGEILLKVKNIENGWMNNTGKESEHNILIKFKEEFYDSFRKKPEYVDLSFDNDQYVLKFCEEAPKVEFYFKLFDTDMKVYKIKFSIDDPG